MYAAVNVMNMSIDDAMQGGWRLKERKWRLACWITVVAGVAEERRASESFVTMSVLLAHWTNSGHPSSTSMVCGKW